MKETNFKESFVGVIPQDWEVSKIGNHILGFEAGVSVNSSEGSIGHSNVFVLKTSAIRNGKLNICEKKEVLDNETNRVKCPLRKGRLLVSRMNTPELVGECCFVCKDVDNIFLPDRLWQSLPQKKKTLDELWLSYLLSTPSYRSTIKELGTGTSNSMKNISQEAFLNISIPFPPLEEQCRIATALSDIDNLISSLDTLIAKKQSIKQGAMQQLLTCKKRLQGFCSPWVEKKLGELGVTYNGLTGKTKEDFGRGTSQYVTFLNILCNPIIKENLFELVNVKPSEHQNKVKKGDLFFNTSSETPDEVGICSYSLTEIDNLYLNSFCFGFRLKDAQIDGLFLSYFFRSKIGRDLMITLAQGSTRYNLSKEQFLKSSIFIPSTKQEQSAIANILSDMDDEIVILQKKREKYVAIKEGMMEQLLTGKIRLV